MCRKHYMALPRQLRLLHRKAARRVANKVQRDDRGPMFERAREYRIWRKCVDHANRDVGI